MYPLSIYLLILCHMLKGKQLFLYAISFSLLRLILHFKDFQKLVFKFFIFIESKKYKVTFIFGFTLHRIYWLYNNIQYGGEIYFIFCFLKLQLTSSIFHLNIF